MMGHEDRLLLGILVVVLLWADRFLFRVLCCTVVVLPVIVLHPENHVAELLTITTILVATFWAIADLTRGIELDHEVKEQTLRESITIHRNND